MTPLLSANALSFHVRERALVDDVSLSLPPGEILVIVGPNGAGKTTLLKLLTGELRPSRGAAYVDGVDIAATPAWALAARRSVMAQAARLSFPFTVAEVARLGVDGVGRKLSRQRRRAIIDAALAAADVSGLAGRLYQTLSGGEQQRAQFARALAQLEAGRAQFDRQILFLDEPVASLDLHHQIALMEAASAEAAKGAAVIAVLHDLNLAATFADRMIVMSKGRLAAEGKPTDVLSSNLLARDFGVSLPVAEPPAAGLPYILPQHYARKTRAAASSASASF